MMLRFPDENNKHFPANAVQSVQSLPSLPVFESTKILPRNKNDASVVE